MSARESPSTDSVCNAKTMPKPKFRAWAVKDYRTIDLVSSYAAFLVTMTGKQSAFIANYLNPANKTTFLNGTESALKAYDVKSRATASSTASQVLSNQNVRRALEAIAEKAGIGVQVRLGLLRDIAKGEVNRSVTRNYSRNKQGKMELVTRSVSESPTPAAARVQAIREIGEITGTRKLDDSIAAETAMNEAQTLYARIVGDHSITDGKVYALDADTMPNAIVDEPIASGANERDERTQEIDPGAKGGKGPATSYLSDPSEVLDKNLVNGVETPTAIDDAEREFIANAIAQFQGK